MPLLFDDPRNSNLNAAFRPRWPQSPMDNPAVMVPQGDTRFDPFLGTGWGEWLDAAGAGRPGGVRMAGSSLDLSPEPMTKQPFAPIVDSGAPLGDYRVDPAISGLRRAAAKGKK